VAKLSYENDQGNRFEILKDSHISVKGKKGKEFFWEWESATAVHQELEQMLAQGEKMRQRLIDLVESRPFIAADD
jgi:hypothetical protein